MLRWAPAPPCWAQGTGCKLQTRCAVPLRPQLPGSLTEGERPRPPGRAGWQQSGRPRKPRTPRPAPAHLGTARETVTPLPPPECPSRLWIRRLSHRAAVHKAHSTCWRVCGPSPRRDARPGPGTRLASGSGGTGRGEWRLDGQTDASLSDFRNSCQLFLRFEPSVQTSRTLMSAPEIAHLEGGRLSSALTGRGRAKNSQVHGRRGRSGAAPRGFELGAQTCSSSTISAGPQRHPAGPASTVRLSPSVGGPGKLVCCLPFSHSQRSLKCPNSPAARA